MSDEEYEEALVDEKKKRKGQDDDDDDDDDDDVDKLTDENETIKLLNSLSIDANSVCDSAKNLLSRIEDGNLPTSKGISFLEMKNEMLLSYLIDLTYLIMLKANGDKICGESTIERLVEIRTVLEKMRPIDHKLKYQVDKLVQTASTGAVNVNDPLRFRPKIGNFIPEDQQEEGMEVNESDDDDDDDDEGEGQTSQKMKMKQKSGVYVPPKVAAMKYDADDTIKDRRMRLLESQKKRAISSEIIQELRREFDEGPIEEVTESNRRKIDRHMKEKTAYEEEHMTRLNMTRKERNSAKQMMTMSSLSNDVTRFQDISVLDVTNPNDLRIPNKKKKFAPKKFKSKRFGGSKFNKRRK